jgi:tripartite-type tricarboxylate transporter receptor subunit TctC
MKKIVLALLACMLWSPDVFAQAPYYQGKTIRIVVGYLPGDGYDLWARLFARHMDRYIPGHPNIIVQNMPGAGSVIAANYVYSAAKPDGLTIGAIGPSLYLDQLLGRKGIQFDWAKFTWLGSPEPTDFVFFIRSDTGFQTVEDIRRAKAPPKCSGTVKGSSGYFVPRILTEALGAETDVILGYQGGAAQDLAVERGEVVCRSLTIQTFFAREPFHTWREKAFVKVLVQLGVERHPKLPDVPTVYELMEKHNTPEVTRRVVRTILAGGTIGRPFIASPGMPVEGVRTLRQAFMETMRDPKFRGEAERIGLELKPYSGEDLEALVKEVMSAPPEVIKQIKKILGT